MAESGYQFQSALERFHVPGGIPNSTKARDPWRDPLGLGADLGTIIGYRYRATHHSLGRYLDKKCGSDSKNQSKEHIEDTDLLLDTGAVKEEETTKEIVSLDNEKADGDGRDMRLAARKNILQIDLVILDDILMEMRFKSKRSASRGFSALVLINFLYQYGRLHSSSPVALDYILWAFATLSTGYALTTVSTWGLVMWCSRRAKIVLGKLKTESLTNRDRTALDGWWWGTLEWVAGFNTAPFMYLFWPGPQ